jgi:hypothetical protein
MWFHDAVDGVAKKSLWSSIKAVLNTYFWGLASLVMTGNAGKLVRVNAGGTALELVAPATVANPGLVWLAGGTISPGAASLDINLSTYTAYKGFEIHLKSLIPTVNASDLLCRFSTNAGVAYISSAAAYAWNNNVAFSGSTPPTNTNSGGDTKIQIEAASSTTGGISGRVTLLDPFNASIYSRISAEMEAMYTTGLFRTIRSGGVRLNAEDTDAIQFYFSGGTIASGKYEVYGYV